MIIKKYLKDYKISYTKHHLNHGEEISVKKLKTVKNSFIYGFLRQEIPVINGCLVLEPPCYFRNDLFIDTIIYICYGIIRSSMEKRNIYNGRKAYQNI